MNSRCLSTVAESGVSGTATTPTRRVLELLSHGTGEGKRGESSDSPEKRKYRWGRCCRGEAREKIIGENEPPGDSFSQLIRQREVKRRPRKGLQAMLIICWEVRTARGVTG